MYIALWILQVLLGLLFVWAGGFKLVVPIETMTSQNANPHAWMVPAVHWRGRTAGWARAALAGPAAHSSRADAAGGGGVVIIMASATGMTLAAGAVGPAMFPLAVGLLLVFVASGRWRLMPVRAK